MLIPCFAAQCKTETQYYTERATKQTPWFQTDMTLSYGTGGSGGAGGRGGLLVCPPYCSDADIDIAEAVEAENTTMAGATTHTTTNGNTTAVEFEPIRGC